MAQFDSRRSRNSRRKDTYGVRMVNPLGSNKSSSDKKFYEKDLVAEVSDVRSGYGYKGITITIDLK